MFQRFSIEVCWVGLRKEGRNWYWINNERAVSCSILWNRGEPNGNTKRVEGCGEITARLHPVDSGFSGRTMNDNACHVKWLGLCEKQLRM